MAVTIHWLVTTPRLPAGLLSAQAWDLLRSGEPVYGAAGDPQLKALRANGIDATELPTDQAVAVLRDRGGVWITAGEDEPVAKALSELLVAEPGSFDLELTFGSWDPRGAQLLDLVEVIDRLRSPGGCPWDREQTHESLAPFLLEEAYETIDAIDSGDMEHLREELGDLLMQPLLHARLASEDEDEGFTIGDVAADVTAKLVRRHPHVFADVTVDSVAELNETWEALKRDEKPDRKHAVDGVATGQPALSLAAKYVSRIRRAGLDVPLTDPATASSLRPAAAPAGADAATIPTDQPAEGIDVAAAAASSDALGAALLRLTAAAQAAGLDPELALRKAALELAARSREVQDAVKGG